MMPHLYLLASHGSLVTIRHFCSVRTGPGEPWHPGACVLDAGRLRTVRLDELLETECVA